MTDDPGKKAIGPYATNQENTMPVRIKLAQGEELLLDVDVAEWNDAFQQALASDKMLEIRDSRGRVLAINPHQVLYLEEVPDHGRDREAAAEAVAAQ